MFPRIFISFLGGMTAAFSLLWMMQWLVIRDGDTVQQQSVRPVMEFVRLKHETETRLRKREKPDEPPPPEETPPQMPEMMDIAQPIINSPAIDFALPDVSFAMDGPYIGPFSKSGDRDFMAIARMPPQYPYQAARKGIEGWVKVSFLITEQGLVKDVVVIDAKPQGIFEHAALRAVMKWRFKPRIEDGKPVATRAEQTVNFQLNDKQP
ncbi:MAG: energy transducer TonB [Gammaproteobacteria bacterium]|nr:energy transducer TonB [Gammaproteobacteria bacterium]